MDEEMKELKSVLRSLVVSSPAQVDVRSLQRDYRTMMGSAIPVHKWGYRDVLTFLQERCKDCFLIQGYSGNPVLTLIVPDTLKHIDQFVQKQKASSITKMKGKRRSVPDTVTKTPEKPIYEQSLNMISDTFNTKRPNSNQVVRPITKSQPLHTKSYNQELNPTSNNVPISPYSNTLEKKSIVNKYPVRTNSNMATNNSCSRDNTAADKTKSPTYKPECTYVEPHRHELQESDRDMDTNGKVRNFLNKRLPMFDSALELDSKHTTESNKVAAKQASDSGRLTASSGGASRRARLHELVGELLELLEAHPRGIVITDLMRHYRERFGREIELLHYGHHTLTSLLCALDDRVAFAESAEGVRVLDPRAPPPPRQRPRHVVPTRMPTARSDPDDALPGIDIDPEVYPADCMHLLDSIPGPDLDGVRSGAMLEVAVAEVYSPTHFWLQRLGAAHAGAMHAVMDDMTDYYSGEGRDRVLPRAAVRAGHYCAALFDGDWHRALIVKVLDSDNVKVRYVDYGTVASAKVRSLKPLLRQYGALPAQAVRARLAGLRPGASARRWPHSAAAYFLDLVRDRYFVANVVAVDEEEDVLETLLIDTSGEDDVCLSTVMVRTGHADRRGDTALASGESYLLPHWAALEAADTPSYSEIHHYLELGIDLECVEEYRRHVPAAVPELPPAPAPDVAASMRVLRLKSPSPVACSLNVAATPDVPCESRVSTPQPARPASPQAPLAPRVPLVLPCAPLVSPRAPLVSPRAPLVSTRASLVSPREPLVKPRAPLVSTRAPLVSTRAPLVMPHAPLVSPRVPLVSTRAPLVSPRAPLVSPRAPLVSTRAPFVSPLAPPRAQHAPLRAPPLPQPQPCVVDTQQSNIVHNASQASLPASSPQLPLTTPPCCETCQWAQQQLDAKLQEIYAALDPEVPELRRSAVGRAAGDMQAAPARYVSVSELYSTDEVELLLDEIRELEPTSCRGEDVQDFEIAGSGCGGGGRSPAGTELTERSWDSHAHYLREPPPRPAPLAPLYCHCAHLCAAHGLLTLLVVVLSVCTVSVEWAGGGARLAAGARPLALAALSSALLHAALLALRLTRLHRLLPLHWDAISMYSCIWTLVAECGGASILLHAALAAHRPARLDLAAVTLGYCGALAASLLAALLVRRRLRAPAGGARGAYRAVPTASPAPPSAPL